MLAGALDGDDWEAALPETGPPEGAGAGILDSQTSGADIVTKGEGAAADCVMAYFGDHQVKAALSEASLACTQTRCTVRAQHTCEVRSSGRAHMSHAVSHLGAQARSMPQVAFFKFLVELSKAPPPWLRMVGKRGTFFAPLDPRRPPSTSLPKLLKKCAKTPEP